MKKFYIRLCYAIFILMIFGNISCEHLGKKTLIPKNSGQMILVITDSDESSKGTLYRFERNISNPCWKMTDEKIDVVLGRNGIAWGEGLHTITDSLGLTAKEEGDGKSPAGIFSLGPAFGYASVDSMSHLKTPYFHITEMTECVDDANSIFYNYILSREKIKQVDWKSSEKMASMGIYYELGVFINHNIKPAKKGAGSCIFLHNWANPDETMAGCTAMAPENMKAIVEWLDADQSPVFVQLSGRLFENLRQSWLLPAPGEN